jgi:hypothetical protein
MKPLLSVLVSFIAISFSAPGSVGQTLVPENFAVEVDVGSTWTYTGVYLFEGDTVVVLANGAINTSGPESDGWQDWFGPDGKAPSQSGGCTDCPLPGYRTGALIARIGAGPPFLIGSFFAFVCDNSGELQFGVNENETANNRGHLQTFVWRLGDPAATAARTDEPTAAPEFALYQNHPNPFNPSTKISFSIPHESMVSITIFDAAGRRVRRLVESAYPAGLHSVQWDGRNDQGHEISSGVYFYRLDANRQRLSRKMILLK